MRPSHCLGLLLLLPSLALGAQGSSFVRDSSGQALGEVKSAERSLEVVIRKPEGTPLEGAFVVLVPEPLGQDNLERKTDAQGRTNFAIPVGRYRLLAFWQEENQFERYVWQDISVASGTAAPPVELRFPPPPAGTISGQILSADGVPAGGAKVEARQRFPSLAPDGDFLRNTAYPRESATTQADEEGRFTLRNLREGEYMLSLEHERGFGEAIALTGAPSAPMKLWGSRCAKTASGRVIDEHGAPVRDFEIGPERFKDPRGRFKIQGACVVLIRTKAFLPRYVPLPRPMPEHVELGDIVLERGRTLSGRVVRSDGKSAGGLLLEVNSEESRTDKSGRFTAGPVPVGEDAWVVLEEQGVTLRQRVRAGTKGEVTVRFPPGSSRLDVRVLRGEGRFSTPVRVTAEGEWGSISVPTDGSGHALLSVPPGPHELRAAEEPQQPSERSRIVPLRFPSPSVQVPEEGTLPLEIAPARGRGRLRVLLPRPTHYDDVYVVPGEQPWPADRHAWLRIQEHALPADAKADIWAQSGLPIIYYEVLNDFSELVPGRYTVFTTNSYGDDEGLPLFRQVAEVTGSGRQVVQVRFEGENTRVLHW